MGLKRMMRRKKQRDWNYDQYSRRQRLEAERKRVQACRAKMLERFKEVVPQFVPKWMQVASLYIPPRWWIVGITWLVTKLPPAKYVAWAVTRKTPYWVKWFMVMPFSLIGRLLDLVAIRPFLYLRRFVRTFGIRTTIRKHDKEHLRMVIRYWFRVIEDSTWRL